MVTSETSAQERDNAFHSVSITGVRKSFGASPVLHDVTVDIAAGEFLTLFGPSGCGKSTLLRIIAGLEAQNAGAVAIGGRMVDGVRPKWRNVAMVFQSCALYAHMTVARNIALPLRMPLSNLDAKLRVQMRVEIKELHRRLGATFIYVTHDQTEAMTLSDRVAVMLDGELLQVAPPEEIYADPAERRAAEFIGSPKINMMDATVREHGYASARGSAMTVTMEHSLASADASRAARGRKLAEAMTAWALIAPALLGLVVLFL
jgi:ABC-type sugar transport system ATPase subunit